MELKEIKDILDAQGKAFEEFKKANDERMAEMAKKGAADPVLTEKVDKLNAEISRLGELKAAVLALETKANRPAGGEGSATDPVKAEHKAAFDRFMRKGEVAGLRDLQQKALSVGVDASGGFTVPDEFERTLIQALEAENIMRKLATVIQTASGSREIPIVSAHGTAAWVGEAAAFTESDETFANKTLSAFKAGTIIKVSEELLHDSAFNLESYIANEFGRRVGRLEEIGFVNGTGTGQPKGVVTDAEVGKVGLAGQTTSVIAADLIDVFHALKRPYRARARWLMGDAAAKVIRKLADTTGQYLWQPGLAAGAPDTLLGRPVEISDDVPAMAVSAKSILFGDFSYYWIVDRVGRVFQRLNELYAANGQVGFRAFQRVDGKLILTEAVKYYQNSAT